MVDTTIAIQGSKSSNVCYVPPQLKVKRRIARVDANREPVIFELLDVSNMLLVCFTLRNAHLVPINTRRDSRHEHWPHHNATLLARRQLAYFQFGDAAGCSRLQQDIVTRALVGGYILACRPWAHAQCSPRPSV